MVSERTGRTTRMLEMAMEAAGERGAGRGKEPTVTIKEMLGKFHVCIKRSKTWKEIVGEFSSMEHAEMFRGGLGRNYARLKVAVCAAVR